MHPPLSFSHWTGMIFLEILVFADFPSTSIQRAPIQHAQDRGSPNVVECFTATN